MCHCRPRISINIIRFNCFCTVRCSIQWFSTTRNYNISFKNTVQAALYLVWLKLATSTHLWSFASNSKQESKEVKVPKPKLFMQPPKTYILSINSQINFTIIIHFSYFTTSFIGKWIFFNWHSLCSCALSWPPKIKTLFFTKTKMWYSRPFIIA